MPMAAVGGYSRSHAGSALCLDYLPVAYADSTCTLLDSTLLHLDTPSDIAQLDHSDNAETHLGPAVECLERMEPIIRTREPRAMDGVDMDQVHRVRQQLPIYRQIEERLQTVAACVNAGIAHMEQFLDGTVRRVYPHLEDWIDSDRIMEDKFLPMTKLITDPVVKGAQTKAHNAALIAKVTTSASPDAGQDPGTTQPSGAAPSPDASGSTTPATPAAPAVTPRVPTPQAVRSAPRAAAAPSATKRRK